MGSSPYNMNVYDVLKGYTAILRCPARLGAGSTPSGGFGNSRVRTRVKTTELGLAPALGSAPTSLAPLAPRLPSPP